MNAQTFLSRVDLDAISPSVPTEAFWKFTEAYLETKNFDAAIASISKLWLPDVLARYENAFRIFGHQSGLFNRRS